MSAAQYARIDTAASTIQPISAAGRWQNLRRTSEFWTRAGNVYAMYKVAQVKIARGTCATSLYKCRARYTRKSALHGLWSLADCGVSAVAMEFIVRSAEKRHGIYLAVSLAPCISGTEQRLQ
jgi:hypothetical protein